jgi:nucleoside-diphosphate-sugar epimerase
MYVDDCVDGVVRLTESDHPEPLNLGSEELISVDAMVDLVCDIAGKRLAKRHDIAKPQGVRGRNSDNAKLREALGWEPQTKLRVGLAGTYEWISSQLVGGEEPAEIVPGLIP